VVAWVASPEARMGKAMKRCILLQTGSDGWVAFSAVYDA